MKAPKKLRGQSGDAPKSELTRLKELWRDKLSESQRDYWRSQFISQTPTKETRESLQVKYGINLETDDQIVRFRKWDEQEQERQGEADRMSADENFYHDLHPEWTSEQLRQEVIDAAKRRALATGNFALGLSAVQVDQTEQTGKFNASMETQKLALKREAETRMQQQFLLAREQFELEAAEKFLDLALRAKADEINASGLSQADKIAAMRQAAFKDVKALQASGKLKIPKA